MINQALMIIIYITLQALYINLQKMTLQKGVNLNIKNVG